MPCHVPTCPTRPGPSGFCALHQNRLNARASGLAEHMTTTDRIAIAAHPGWRGRKWRLMPVWWPEGVRFHASHVTDGLGPDFPTAFEALAELDHKNGLAPAADVARLGAEVGGLTLAVAVARVERDTARAYADAIRTHRDALEERRRELAADNGLLAGDVAWLERLADRLRAALDKQAATAAGLRSELAERERDVTDLCAERDGYAADLETARRTALADADTIDNLRTGVGHLETALTLARRPWWRKVWAWVTGGGA